MNNKEFYNMFNSEIQKEFAYWCRSIHPEINPTIFIKKHNRYSDEYLPLVEKILVDFHQSIHDKCPGVTFSFKGRLKSLRSFLIKSFDKIATNIDIIFSNKPLSQEESKKRDDVFYDCFKFIKKNDPERYEILKKQIDTLNSSFSPIESFSIIFDKLSSVEKNQLVSRLGRTEDIFAFRPVVHCVDFDINSIFQQNDGQYGIVYTKKGLDGLVKKSTLSINPAIQLNPETDIKTEDGVNYVNINGKKQFLNELNLLYDDSITNSKRCYENALKTKEGYITLLQDAIVLQNGDVLDVQSIEYDDNKKSYFILTTNGERKNLSKLLQNGCIKLRKHDEETCTKAVYDIYEVLKNFYKENNIKSLKHRFKDYIQNPKHDQYKSIHDSAYAEDFGITFEAQFRTLLMEHMAKDESTRIGHDAYKKEKSKKRDKNPILSKLYREDKSVFDSSTDTLVKLLENPDVDIYDVLGKYILITSFPDGKSYAYQPSIADVFNHMFFENVKNNNLKFKSYSDYMAWRAQARKSQENHDFPDLDEI